MAAFFSSCHRGEHGLSGLRRRPTLSDPALFLSLIPFPEVMRRFSFAGWALGLASVGCCADATKAELAAWLALQPKWSVSVSAESAAGYKDNLLLSANGPEGSPFVRGAADFLLLHVPQGPADFSFFGQVERTQFLADRSVDGETSVWVQTDGGYRWGDRFKVSLPVTGYFYDQVFDVSDTDVERLVAELRVQGLMVGPTLRWTPGPAWWLEAQALGERKRYDDGANDGDIGEGRMQLGWQPGARWRLSAAWQQRWRKFDRRAQYSAAGRELAGTALKIAEDEGEARAEITWDRAGRWKSTLRLARLSYRDNGSGYFSYTDRKSAVETEWRSDLWRVRLDATANRVEFDVQTVGFGIDPPARIKEEYGATLRAERKLGPRWILLAEYGWERSRSNDRFASYRVNEGLLGARWSWEK